MACSKKYKGDENTILSCHECQILLKIKYSSSTVLYNCKCDNYVFCSFNCRNKNEHFKQCDGSGECNCSGKSRLQEEGARVEKLINSMREVIIGKLSIEDKTFEELVEMKDNPWACMKVADSLRQNVESSNCPCITPLFPEYAEMTSMERAGLAIKWVNRAHENGHPGACFDLGRLMLADDTYDRRDAMEYFAEAAERGISQEFEEFSMLIKQINLGIESMTDEDNQGPIHYVRYLGGLVMARCKDKLLEIMQDTPGVGLSRNEWGFKQIHQYREALKNENLFKDVTFDFDFVRNVFPEQEVLAFDPKGEIKFWSKKSPKYVDAPCFDPEAAMNDLKRVTGGLLDIDYADHAWYFCSHFICDGECPGGCLKLSREICRTCFTSGVDRVRAVASGAYCISLNAIDDSNSMYKVIFEVEEENQNRLVKSEVFYGFCKTEVSTALRLLSVHSADVDPRMICLNQELYWSIIWIYGSVTEALKAAGGQRLYDIGFGEHQLLDESYQYRMEWEELQDFIELMEFTPEQSCRMMRMNQVKLPPPSECPGMDEFDQYDLKSKSELLNNNFVSRFKNKERTWRHNCSRHGCYNLEDEEKFLHCQNCKDFYLRKYCSSECQRIDWKTHKKHCKEFVEDNSPSTSSWMKSKQNKNNKKTKKKVKGRKKF